MIEISFGSSYSNLSPTVTFQSALRIGRLNWLMKSNGIHLLLLIRALN
jgi:hypothetical protein